MAGVDEIQGPIMADYLREQVKNLDIEHVGGEPGMFPESTFLFECACADDPAMRVAGVNRGLEGLACDVLTPCQEFARTQRELGFWGGESEIERAEAGYAPTTPVIGLRRHRSARTA